MDLVLRAAFIYFFVLLVLRLSGKRTLGQLGTFDFVLLMLMAESTDNSIIGQDSAITSTVVVILTFIVLEIFMSVLKQRVPATDKWLEGVPLVIVENGKFIKDTADKERVDEGDVLQAARQSHGLERMEQIKYAILEKTGGISVIPK